MSKHAISALEQQHRALALELRGLFAQVGAARDVVGAIRDLDPHIGRLRTSIEALELSIATFSPDWNPAGNTVRIRTKRSPFEKKGQLRAHVIALMKASDRAWTQDELLKEIIERYVDRHLDHRDRGNLQSGLRNTLQRDCAKGLLERLNEPERWRLLRKSERPSTMSLAPASTAGSDV